MGGILPDSNWWRHPAVAATRSMPAKLDRVAAVGIVPFWAMMSFTVILFAAPQAFFPALVSLRIALLAALAAMITYVVDRLLRRERVIRLSREIWITACLVVWAIMTVPFSYWPGGSVWFLLGFYFKTLAIFGLLTQIVTSEASLGRVAWALSWLAVPLAGTAVDNYLSGTFLEGNQEVMRIAGYDSPLSSNPNDLALTLNLILPFSVALLMSTRRPTVRILLAGVIALDVVGIIITFSRGGFITLLTTSLVYQWKLRKRRERRWVLVALAVVLLSIPTLPGVYFERLSTIVQIEADRTGSAQARWADSVAALSFILQHPIIGGGVGMDALVLNEQRGATWKNVHNVYLQYGVDLGLPGLALFLGLLFGCFQCARIARRRAEEAALRELFYLAEALQLSLVAFTVAAFFHPIAYHLHFYYIAGLAVAVRFIAEPRAGRRGPLGVRSLRERVASP